MTLSRLTAASLLALAAVSASPAFAQEEVAKPLDISFSLAGVSDYRFRGVSLSNEDFAVQPGVTLTHKSGVSLGLWGSNVASNGGDDIELDATLGYTRSFGKVTAGISAVAYLYPGASGLNYGEGIATLGTSIGKASVGATFAYAPKQANIGNQDNIYGGINAALPLGESPITLNGSFGIEDGAFGNAKRDWSAGADIDIKGFIAGLKYVDTARTAGVNGAGATVVFSLSKSF